MEKPTQQQVYAVIARQLNKTPNEISAEKRVIEDLGADSLDVVEMLMNLEDEYGIVVPDDVAMKMKTVGDIMDFIMGS